MIGSILAVALAASSIQDPQGFEEMWSDYRVELEAQGVSRPMFRAALVWAEGQYQIGRCRSYIQQSQVEHWRDWWRNTPLERSQIGQMMLRAGEVQFTEGLEDSAVEPLSADTCQRIARSWNADMRAAATAAD